MSTTATVSARARLSVAPQQPTPTTSAGGLPVLLDDGARKYVWGASGLAYTVDKSTAAVQVYHTDGLGSVRAITDSTGSVVQTYQTDEFGIPVSTNGTSLQPLGFTGEQYDGEDGLVYLRARTYDPNIGRFVQRDKLAGTTLNPQSANRFSYVANNPITFVDSSGLSPNSSKILRVSDFPVFHPGVFGLSDSPPASQTAGGWLRTPDYYSVTLNVAIPNPWTATLVGISIPVTVDRYGSTYIGVGPSVGKSATVLSGSGIGGWVLQAEKPTPGQLESFITAWSVNVGGGFVGGGAVNWGNVGSTQLSDFSVEAGVYSPQAGASVTYSWELPYKIILPWQ
jgi:RHS repeat-associated protein